MKKKEVGIRAAKNIAALASLAVCLWCAGSSLCGWAEEHGRDALLFAAGIRAQAVAADSAGLSPEEGPAAPSPSPGEGAAPPPEEIPLFLEDGVVPVHPDLLPEAAATPDPGRPSGPVQELTLDGGQQVADLFVRDTTDSGTDLLAELEQDPPIHLKADGSVEILIYHTHTSEAYAAGYTGFYYADMETRTGNRDRNVTAVGEELKAALEAKGFGVVHDITVNDELFNGSYARSWEVIQSNLEEHPGIRITIDLHRDSMTTEEGLKYKPTVQINGRKAAQIMFLAGCDADGGWGDFPDWEQNLRLILRAQQQVTRMYPGLARPLNFSNNKYNMNATPGSMLVEVGTEVNTVSEARYAGRLLGEALGELFLTLR